MKILGLDMSTSTGVALIEDGKLKHYSLIEVEFHPSQSKIDDYNHIDRAHTMARSVLAFVDSLKPDFIYIEQTNLGKNRTTQKLLEFTHCILLLELSNRPIEVSYVDSSIWRSKLGLSLNKDERKHNKAVKAAKASGIRAVAGQGKKTMKHVAVNYVNAKFDLKFKVKDNDLADAICLADYGYQYRQAPLVQVNFEAIDSIF